MRRPCVNSSNLLTHHSTLTNLVKTQIEAKLKELDEILHTTELDESEKSEVVAEMEKVRLELLGDGLKQRALNGPEDEQEDHPFIAALQNLGTRLVARNPEAASRINTICIGLSRMGI